MQKGLLPFIDLIFLSMGTLLLLMTDMEVVESIPIDLVRVGRAQVSSRKIEEPLFVAINKEGIFVGKEKVSAEELISRTKGEEVILRADKDLPFGKVIQLVASLRQKAVNVSLEVEHE
ncbi:biopolymer transporter ExbD [candidate division NPL-UPA2 bacterium]|nr:biopolymer transporter ExbD [candidate division NPL-UPA2 bacterium]